MKNHIPYMQRCLQLAQLGKGTVSPNPMVGCVVVREDKIIAEGFHQKFGEAHAEVNALQNLGPEDLENAWVYVSLEPCSHHGKTGPCCELLVEKGVRNVVVASEDPNPEVAGNGLRYLKQHGVNVLVGVLSSQEKVLNKAFYHNQKHQLPYVIVKWAESQDGYIGRLNGTAVKISSESSKNWVHQQRHESDAILVGKHTYLNDKPILDARYYSEKELQKVVLSRELVNDSKWIPINPNSLEQALRYLYQEKQIGQLLVEGGAMTIDLFKEKNLVNEIWRIKSESHLGGGISAPEIPKSFFPLEKFNLGKDTLEQFIPV